MDEKILPFWQRKKLTEMSAAEWESLCDGCGLCCLQKLEDEEDGEIYYTRIACHLLDLQSCQCSNYPQRQHLVPTCIQLTADQVDSFRWLPETCAYRLLAQGQALPDWHPLVSGDREQLHREGISLRGQMVSERDIDEDDWEDWIIYRV